MGAKPLLISQRQVTAILKAAAAAGVAYEIRIEGDVVRFVPCPKPDREATEPDRKWHF